MRRDTFPQLWCRYAFVKKVAHTDARKVARAYMFVDESFFYDSIQNHNVQLQVLFDANDGCNKKADEKEEKI